VLVGAATPSSSCGLPVNASTPVRVGRLCLFLGADLQQKITRGKIDKKTQDQLARNRDKLAAAQAEFDGLRAQLLEVGPRLMLAVTPLSSEPCAPFPLVVGRMMLSGLATLSGTVFVRAGRVQHHW
jgi:hypothetical protein